MGSQFLKMGLNTTTQTFATYINQKFLQNVWFGRDAPHDSNICIDLQCIKLVSRHFFLNFPGQKYLNWAYTDEKPNEDENIKQLSLAEILQKNLELANALAVLNISPLTFHTLQSKGKMSRIQNLLETALMARSVEKNEKIYAEMKQDLNGSEDTNLPTVDEAFQFIYKKYVEDMLTNANANANANFLMMDDIRRKHEEQKKKRSKSQTANKEAEMDPKLKEQQSR